MKKFMTPEVELIKFAMIDVITTSACPDDCYDDEDEPVMGLGNCP